MGEAKRRRLAAAMLPPVSQLPDDIKQDIAAIANAMQYVTMGGTCHFRSMAGLYALKLAGIDGAQRCIGGMIYRAGLEPRRDVVAFCGPGNIGCFVDGRFHGHMWLKAGDALIDFSSGHWRHEDELSGPFTDDGYDELGPIQWTAEPPAFLWGQWDSFMPPPHINGTVWTPELGRAAYTGFHGTPEQRRQLDDASPAMRSTLEMLLRQQMALAKQLDIKARVAA